AGVLEGDDPRDPRRGDRGHQYRVRMVWLLGGAPGRAPGPPDARPHAPAPRRYGQPSAPMTVNRAAKVSPGATRGVVPAARAAVGPVIGSRQTNSGPGGADTWAWAWPWPRA